MNPPVVQRNNDQQVSWYCPGCNHRHIIQIAPLNGYPVWDWNGNVEKPTFSPSVWATGEHRCHVFIREGVIDFLGDCSHALAGQKVEMKHEDLECYGKD